LGEEHSTTLSLITNSYFCSAGDLVPLYTFQSIDYTCTESGNSDPQTRHVTRSVCDFYKEEVVTDNITRIKRYSGSGEGEDCELDAEGSLISFSSSQDGLSYHVSNSDSSDEVPLTCEERTSSNSKRRAFCEDHSYPDTTVNDDYIPNQERTATCITDSSVGCYLYYGYREEEVASLSSFEETDCRYGKTYACSFSSRDSYCKYEKDDKAIVVAIGDGFGTDDSIDCFQAFSTEFIP
jgi:hypothetical protein